MNSQLWLLGDLHAKTCGDLRAQFEPSCHTYRDNLSRICGCVRKTD
jgi:hypothetical protein